MSDPSYNTPVYHRQGGSVLTVDSSGTLQILAGGSFQSAGGASFGAGATFGAGASFTGTVGIGGTFGRWAFGSATLASGTTMFYTGLSQVVSVAVTPVTASINAGTGAGTATGFQVDLSRAANGSVFALGVTGTAAFTGAGTVVWQAFGL